MNEISTQYGDLKGSAGIEVFENNNMKECILNEYNEIVTPYGVLIPQYRNDGIRRKYTKSISFYEGGMVKSISLHKQTDIETSIGVFPAELVTFYESGKLKRVFPLNGKITGYWTEDDEYDLTREFDFKFPFGDFKTRIISICFYECGSVKSLTLWPKENVPLMTPLGTMETRIGFSLFRDGRLKSIEPARPTPVETPIGEIAAYNISAVGIHGDTNSLCFYEDGSIQSLVTSTDTIAIENEEGQKRVYGPSVRASMVNMDKMEIVPLWVHFTKNKAWFQDGNKFDIHKYRFTVKHHESIIHQRCSACTGCNGCG